MARTIRVSGMSCTGCEQTVVDSLSELGGVEDARADHKEGTVTVEGDAGEGEVQAAIEEAGYEVEGEANAG
ncbi:MAG: cation transporter [Halalkalicoccus sp.]